MKENEAWSYRFDINNAIHFKELAKSIESLEGDIIDKARELWYANILSGVQTMIANTSSIPYAAWEMGVVRGMKAALGLFQKDGTKAGEYKYLAEGFLPGIARASSNFMATWKAESGFFEEDVMGAEPSEMDEDHRGFYRTGYIKGAKGRFIRWPLRLLLATDDFMKTLIGQMEVGAQAYRFAMAQRLTGTDLQEFITSEINTPGSASWAQAVKEAEKMTFTNQLASKAKGNVDSPLAMAGSAAKAIGDFVRPNQDMNPFYKVASSILSMFFPFVRTPFNILQRGLEYVPGVGALEIAAKTYAAYTMKDGKLIPRGVVPENFKDDVTALAAKQIIGAIITMAIIGAAEGDDDDMGKFFLITGTRPPMDKTGKELAYGTVPPLTVKIGNMKISYARLDPFAVSLGTMIDVIRGAKHVQHGKPASELPGDAMSSVIAQLTEKTYARGFTELSRMFDDGLNPTEWGMRQIIAMAVPNTVRQALRSWDPNMRETNYSGKTASEWLYEALPAAGMPWTPPVKIDRMGKPITKGGNWLSRTFDVTKSGQLDIDPLERMEHNFKMQKPMSDVKSMGSPSGGWTDPLEPDKTKSEKKMTTAQLAKFKEVVGRIQENEFRKYRFNIEKPTILDIENKRKAQEDARSKARLLLYRDPKWRNLK